MKAATIVTIFTCFLITVVGFYFMSKPKQHIFPSVTRVLKTDHKKWNGRKTLIEYSDFQCPACKIYDDAIQQVEKDPSKSAVLSNKFTFIFRNYPLSFHKNALVAAQAAEAAGKQNKFWEMKRELFEAQDKWSVSDNPEKLFALYAQKLGLDIQQFKEDYQSQIVKDKIQTDITSGNAGNLDATPTFYLDGEKLPSKNPDDFMKYLLTL